MTSCVRASNPLRRGSSSRHRSAGIVIHSHRTRPQPRVNTLYTQSLHIARPSDQPAPTGLCQSRPRPSAVASVCPAAAVDWAPRRRDVWRGKEEAGMSQRRRASEPKWEYKLVSIGMLGENQEDGLNELGREGWELTGEVAGGLAFKRLLQPTARPD